jgi:hypothetical protein|tara:strand:- start:706 stop:1134 length:429 start_codon:yes stop_codon:yes gene_type:complete
MSWGTCYSGSNNIHHSNPPLMSDRRLFTNVNPACDLNEKLKKRNGIKSNYEYRQYLMKNGRTIMENNTIKSCDESSECVKRSDEINKTNKYLYKSISDTHTPYGYQQSDLKKLYISRASLQSKYVSPIVTQEDLLRLESLRK